MRYVLAFVFMGVVGAAPMAAKAGAFSVALSAGSGWRLDPDSGRIPTNLMVAPGLNLLGRMLRLEVGFVGDLPDIADSEFDLQIRPMAALYLPILPLYFRLVTGVTQLVNGPIAFAFGGAVGIDATISPSSIVFVEAGFIPRVVNSSFESVFEGRLGLRFGPTP